MKRVAFVVPFLSLANHTYPILVTNQLPSIGEGGGGGWSAYIRFTLSTTGLPIQSTRSLRKCVRVLVPVWCTVIQSNLGASLPPFGAFIIRERIGPGLVFTQEEGQANPPI